MSKWVEEELEPGLRVSYGLKEVLASSKSKWQQVDLVDLQPFGRVLMIDGLVQSCQSDEFVYHESLVHPAMLMHPNPKTVYIGGGGEGSTAREVLRHKSVDKCVMVDIDGDVVEFCRKVRYSLRALKLRRTLCLASSNVATSYPCMWAVVRWIAADVHIHPWVAQGLCDYTL